MQQPQASSDPPLQSRAELGSLMKIFSNLPTPPSTFKISSTTAAEIRNRPILGMLGSPQARPGQCQTVGQIGGIRPLYE